MKKVNKHTRAGKNGKRIFCPECNKPTKVYHFSWSAITCSSCSQMINKLDWLLKERQFRSNQGRNPKNNIETYRMLEFSIILFTIISIIYLISQL
jgi:ribosomal protein S27E